YFFRSPAPPHLPSLSLHDALPISWPRPLRVGAHRAHLSGEGHLTLPRRASIDHMDTLQRRRARADGSAAGRARVLALLLGGLAAAAPGPVAAAPTPPGARSFGIARLKYGGGGDWYGDNTSLRNLITGVRQRT